MAMKFGLIVPQGWRMDLVGSPAPVEAYETMTRVAQEAEALGFDSIWLYDHFHTVPTPTQEVTFECWTSTAALARDTKRVRIGQMVTCNGYRNPALLAKMASTVDAMSHGRLDCGIGAGWYEQEFLAYGYDFPDGPTRLRQLREAVQIILKMWTDEKAEFEGQYHSVHGAINQPKGVQKPHIPLLIGGAGEKVTLKLVAQYGDACNVGDDPATMKQKFAVLKAHCEAVGREYESIHRMTRTMCIIGETDEQALASLPEQIKAYINTFVEKEEWHGAMNIDPLHIWASFLGLVGSPETIRRQIAAYEAAGVQEMRLIFLDLESIQRFAKEFIA